MLFPLSKVNDMLKEKLDPNLFPALLFILLVIYLIFSDPSAVGPL